MYREVASLDVEVAIARKAQHVLTLGVPGDTVRIRLLWETCKGGGEAGKRKGNKVKKVNTDQVVMVMVQHVPLPDVNNCTYCILTFLFQSIPLHF